MTRSLFIFTVICCALVRLGVAQTAVPTRQPSLQITRTVLDPSNPDTATTFIESGAAALLPAGAGGVAIPGAFTLVGASGAPIALTQYQPTQVLDYVDASHGTGLIVPSGTPPGQYGLSMLNPSRVAMPTGITITVKSLATGRPLVVVPPLGPNAAGQWQDDQYPIQAALNNGNDVLLEPGRYTFFHHVTAPPNVRILCSGIGVTVLRRVHNPNDYEDEFFEATGAMTLEDATFESDPNYPGAIVVHVTPPTNDSGTIIRRIRCVQTQGFWIGGAGDWIDDIEFDGGCPFANQSNQLWTNILFKNIGHDPLVSGVGTAAINWTFEGTNRGFVMRSGPTQSLFENIVFRNVQQCPNGDELMLAEDPPSASNPNPPGVQGCYFSHIFAQHCNGTLLHLGATPASNNLWRSMMADGGLGILFNAAGTDQSGNQLQDIELRNGLGIGFIGATGNTLNGIAIVNPQVTRGNQNDWQATYYGRHEAISGLSGNRATQISIRGLSAGWISGLPDDALDQ